jgi:hypothetical protein
MAGYQPCRLVAGDDVPATWGIPMRKLLFILTSMAMLGACSTTEDARQALQTEWIGRSADDFVSRYGFPQGQYQLQNGDTLLAWGDQRSVRMPQSSTTSGYVSPSTGYFTAHTQTSGGYDIGVSCDLQLTVSNSGTIKAIRITRDTIGMWETSRCAEIFD